VVPACSPSYSGGRDQSQPGQKVRETLSQKTLHKNRAGGVAQGEGPEFKPHCRRQGGGGDGRDRGMRGMGGVERQTWI
jgi:hypothetical protein